MPSLRPRTSWLPRADLSQTPACIAVSFSVSRRVSAMSSASASSTTLRVFENGALKTATPRSAAPDRSIWFVPMPKPPTARRSGAASSTLSGTCVPERMPSSSTPGSRSASSATSKARFSVDTSKPAATRTASACGWMPSRSRARRGRAGGGVATGTSSMTPRTGSRRRRPVRWRARTGLSGRCRRRRRSDLRRRRGRVRRATDALGEGASSSRARRNADRRALVVRGGGARAGCCGDDQEVRLSHCVHVRDPPAADGDVGWGSPGERRPVRSRYRYSASRRPHRWSPIRGFGLTARRTAVCSRARSGAAEAGRPTGKAGVRELGERFDAVLAAAARGDGAAFAELWRATHPRLLRDLRVSAGNLAEDAASETWLKAMRALPSFVGDEPAFRGWLTVIARNVVHDLGRYASRRPETLVADPEPARHGTSPDAADEALERLGTERALRLLATLPPAQAEMVALRVIVGLEPTEIGLI